jgi:outer membrane protein OmpA-like peptidoglycan-associated protein
MFMTIRRPLAFSAAAIAILALAGCATDDESQAGSPFTQALAANYTDLAAQAPSTPAPERDLSFLDEMAVFTANPFGMFGDEGTENLLAQAYTAKADLAAQGQEPAPEPAPSDQSSQSLHDRLIRAVAAGKDRFPDQSARVQTNYDCWVLSAAAGQAAASAACKASLDGSLAALENAARPAPAPSSFPASGFPVAPVAPVAPPPVAAAPVAAPTAENTVYFDFNSWTLTAENLTVITNVINTARAGGQSRITVVGHTDTSGAPDYNQRLSVRRANVVVEALVDMGARRAAIQASGVGETDLAVQTPDGTKEAKNRRAVIGLLP